MFAIGDKVIRVGSVTDKSRVCWDYTGPQPQFGVVYVVNDCWQTSLGPQCMFIGFGGPYYFNGYKTGWGCKFFRKLEEIQAENREKVSEAHHQNLPP